MGIEKVIKGIDICLQRFHCGEDCPYYNVGCMEQLREDSLAMLKEQDPVEPYEDFNGHYVWRCGNCGATIFRINRDASDEDEKNFARFCKHCGRRVKWNE